MENRQLVNHSVDVQMETEGKDVSWETLFSGSDITLRHLQND